MADDELVVDLTNYKDRVGSRVTPGTYRVQVEDVESVMAASGNPMINLFLRVVGGEFDGQTLMDRLVQTPNSMFRTVGFMQAIGLPTPRKRLKINVRQFIGRVLDVAVEDGEPYLGRVKSEVRGYTKVVGAKQPADDDLDTGDGPDDLPGDSGGLDEFAPVDKPEEDGTPVISSQQPAPRSVTTSAKDGAAVATPGVADELEDGSDDLDLENVDL